MSFRYGKIAVFLFPIPSYKRAFKKAGAPPSGFLFSRFFQTVLLRRHRRRFRRLDFSSRPFMPFRMGIIRAVFLGQAPIPPRRRRRREVLRNCRSRRPPTRRRNFLPTRIPPARRRSKATTCPFRRARSPPRILPRPDKRRGRPAFLSAFRRNFPRIRAA